MHSTHNSGLTKRVTAHNIDKVVDDIDVTSPTRH